MTKELYRGQYNSPTHKGEGLIPKIPYITFDAYISGLTMRLFSCFREREDSLRMRCSEVRGPGSHRSYLSCTSPTNTRPTYGLVFILNARLIGESNFDTNHGCLLIPQITPNSAAELQLLVSDSAHLRVSNVNDYIRLSSFKITLALEDLRPAPT